MREVGHFKLTAHGNPLRLVMLSLQSKYTISMEVCEFENDDAFAKRGGVVG